MKRHHWLLSLAAIATLVGLGAVWRTRQELLLRRAAALQTQRDYESLKSEHARLLAQAPSSGDWDTLRRAGAEAARLRVALSSRPEAITAATASNASVKFVDETDWVPGTHWRNRGNASPADAVETTFWAAANGDLSVLRDVIELSPEARAKAIEVLARLPAEARARYTSPEDLAALFTARDAFFQGAQLVYNQLLDDDHALAAMIVKSADGKSREVSVSLHRVDDAWRLVMPTAAMAKIAAELAGGGTGTKPDVPPPRGTP
ncbi:MAG: hypothetical protein H7343_18830 [Undibacterium sp.]|nr:hypothetical protein [Opitutaceae bacterium]